MAVKLTRLTHKIAIQLHLVAESCTIYSSRPRRPVRKLFDTLSCVDFREVSYKGVKRVTQDRVQWRAAVSENLMVSLALGLHK
jgi:hypothetical protein